MAKPSVRAVVQGLLATAAYVTAYGAFAAAPVADEVHSWNIPAEDGPSALRDFGVQSGVAISAVQTDVEGLKLNAVTGSMSVDKALQMLVAGTGLKYIYDATGRAVTLTVTTKAAPKTATVPTSTKADPPPTADDEVLLEEIVVTARKREENLQDVPISAQVVTGQTLADYNIKSLTELSQSLPGIQLNSTGAGGQFFIRGIGSGASFQFDQSVGTFIDDIFHGRTRVADEAFLDLDRVEVLKGPQSTFFGNNAVAGALNIVTAKPNTDNFDGSARALYGEYGQYAGEGILNIPLSSDFAMRIAAIGDGESGWANDAAAGRKEPDQNNKAGRVSFLYRPSDVFDATLKIEGGDNQESDGGVVGGCPPPYPVVTAAGVSSPQGFCKLGLAAGYKFGISNFNDTTNGGQGLSLSTLEDVLTMHYHIGEETLTSVTGFYNYHFTENLDADGTPLVDFNQQTKDVYHQFSQELRIASPQGETIEWMAGLYVQEDHLGGAAGNISEGYIDSTSIAAAAKGTAGAAKKAAALALQGLEPLGTYGQYNQTEHSYAAFASIDWNITDQLKVGAGMRGTWDYKNATQTSLWGAGFGQPYGLYPLQGALQADAVTLLGARQPGWSAANSYNAAMPSAEIDYKIVPAVLLYATYAKGFLAGNPADVGYVQNGIPTPAVRPEYVNAYEAGMKSNLFDNHVRLNLDVFRSNYKDLQVGNSIVTATASVAEITNAAASRTQGVELSGEWVQSGFRFRTDVTYLDSRYIDFKNVTDTGFQTYCSTAANVKIPACLAAFPNGVGTLQDLSGKPTEFAPTWSGSVTTSYSFSLPRGYHFITEADALGSTDYYFGNNGTDDPQLMQQGYIRLDGRLSLESPNERWAVDIIMKNLTDKLIFLGGAGGTALPISSGSTLLQVDQPRNFAIQARYQW